MHLLHSVIKLLPALVLHRPSKVIKSPYLADILVDNVEYLAHTPSLGCKGLIVTDAHVLVTPKLNTKSKYSVDVVISDGGVKVGVNPSYSTHIVQSMINRNLIQGLTDLDELRKEVTKNKSRLDFVGKKGDKTYYIEVKNVPLIDTRGVAIFPDGFRASKKDTISPRAVKHIEELEHIKLTEPNSECYIIFTIQRTGCTHFTPAKTDPIFRDALLKAMKNNVIVKAYQVSWIGNEVYYDRELVILV